MCGSEFTKSAYKCNRREADSWEEWAKDYYDECPDCFKARMEAENEAAPGCALPELEAVSDKQMAYAVSMKKRCRITPAPAGNTTPIHVVKGFKGDNLDEKNIYRFGMGLNMSGLKDTSATTNVAIKAAESGKSGLQEFRRTRIDEMDILILFEGTLKEALKYKK